MANYDNQQARYGTHAGSVPAVDEGLRDYMLRVYNYMGVGLAITGLAAIVMSTLAISSEPTQYALQNGIYLTSLGAAVYGSFLSFIIMLAPLGVIFFMSFRVHKMSVSAAQTTFWVFSLLMGLSLSSIFLVSFVASFLHLLTVIMTIY